MEFTGLEKVMAAAFTALAGTFVGKLWGGRGYMKADMCALKHEGLDTLLTTWHEDTKDRLERIENKIDTLNGGSDG